MGGILSADASPAEEARARASAGSAVIGMTRAKVLSNHLAAVSTREGLLSSLVLIRLLHNAHVWGERYH
eukprot:12271360-Alexandrium_andersonii.AAC.1